MSAREEVLADVLAEHPFFYPTRCGCGWRAVIVADAADANGVAVRVQHHAHVAAALDAALGEREAEVRAAALWEAADDLEGRLGTEGAPKTLWAFRKWLRDRAKRIKAEAATP